MDKKIERQVRIGLGKLQGILWDLLPIITSRYGEAIEVKCLAQGQNMLVAMGLELANYRDYEPCDLSTVRHASFPLKKIRLSGDFCTQPFRESLHIGLFKSGCQKKSWCWNKWWGHFYSKMKATFMCIKIMLEIKNAWMMLNNIPNCSTRSSTRNRNVNRTNFVRRFVYEI